MRRQIWPDIQLCQQVMYAYSIAVQQTNNYGFGQQNIGLEMCQI